MKIPFYQLDAFANKLFAGNPAGVCPLTTWLDDATMQSIAAENNLPETAFFVGADGHYHLRWFTPLHEIDLCGHGTLATAHIVFNKLEPALTKVEFETRSGILTVDKKDNWMVMDFPSQPPKPTEAPENIIAAMGSAPTEVLKSADYILVYDNEEDIRQLSPDFYALKAIDTRGIIATAPGNECDFVSRFFAPRLGIDEDPVTGSAHCELTPYWADRLNKQALLARQVSQRGGEIKCELAGDRVKLSGQCVEYLYGEITL